MNWGLKPLAVPFLMLILLSTIFSFSPDIHGQKGRDAPESVVLIHDVYELLNISLDLNGSYALANDIDATSTREWNNGTGFVPIGDVPSKYGIYNTTSNTFYGNPYRAFNGTFDGRGFNIVGLFIDYSTVYSADEELQRWLGLFRVNLHGTIINVNLRDVNITTFGPGPMIGSLVGSNYGTISKCTVTGTIKGNGGLLGINEGNVSNCSSSAVVIGLHDDTGTGGLVADNGGNISNCSSSATVEGDLGVGCLVGNNHGAIMDCHGSGIVKGQECLGGLVGYVSSGHVTRCYSTSIVTGNQTIGGLIGGNHRGFILNCFSCAFVKGNSTAGGLVGKNEHFTGLPRLITNCYSAGPVSAKDNYGGLIGNSSDGYATSSYWDKSKSQLSISAGGTGKDTTEMMKKSSFEGWNFTTPWDILEGKTYPFLRNLNFQISDNGHVSIRDNTSDIFNFTISPDPKPNGTNPIFVLTVGNVIGGATTMAIVAVAFVTVGTEVGKYRFLLLFMPLYTRLTKEEVLDNECRGVLRGFIYAEPGIHYNEILRRLKMGNGKAAHHLNTLEREGYIKSRSDGRFKRFYPAEMKFIGAPPRLTKIQKIIIETLQESEGLSQRDIARVLEMPFSTANRQLKKLAGMGLVRLEKHGITVKCYLIEEAVINPVNDMRPISLETRP